MTRRETVEPTPGWLVIVLGLLLLPLAVGAFTLSFVQLLPVMLFGGWDSSTAWLGPVVLDVTAAAGAVMHVVGRDRAVKGWGLGLLGSATLLSILGNLAGHSIRTPGSGARVPLPGHMTGWVLPGEWQWVVMVLSVAAPTFVAALVHAFGAVVTAWLSTRPAADSGPTRLADSTPSDPTGDPTPVPDSTPTEAIRLSDPTAESALDPGPTDPTRPGPDLAVDLRKSDESGSRPDPTPGLVDYPTAHPTGERVGYPTEPTPDPTESADPTRPDPTPVPDSTDGELTRLLDQARAAVESGRAKPTADSLRVVLGVGSARAREIRDLLKSDQRHGLRAVG